MLFSYGFTGYLYNVTRVEIGNRFRLNFGVTLWRYLCDPIDFTFSIFYGLQPFFHLVGLASVCRPPSHLTLLKKSFFNDRQVDDTGSVIWKIYELSLNMYVSSLLYIFLPVSSR